MKKSEILFGALRIPVDFTLTFLAFLLAYQIRSRTDLLPGIQLPIDLQQFMSWNQYIRLSLLAGFFLITTFAINRAYSLKSTTTISKELFQIFFSSLAWIAILIAWFFFTREIFFSRLVLGYSWLFTLIFIFIGRGLIRTIHLTALKKNIGKRKILFIGINTITNRLFDQFKENPRFKIVGAIDSQLIKKDLPFEILGTINKLKYIVKKHHVDEIIQTKQNLTETEAKDILEFCRENHLEYSFVPELMEVQLSNVELSQFNSLPLISLKQTTLDGWGKVIKRTFDLIGGMILAILTSPIMLTAALAIKIENPKGTILFKYLDDGKLSRRIGEHGKPFSCYKFRTMKMNTHNQRYTTLADKNKRKDSPMVKIENDPRITRVGKFFRKYSIDELPQLFNVIKGEMSLVGPRPHLPEEVAEYKKHHKFVLALKPGMTGMAQTQGRSDLDFEEEVKLDTYYIEHWSIPLDIKILIRTIAVVLSGKAE